LVLATLVWSSSAEAYCRALACSDDDPALKCTKKAGECPSGRPELFWPSSCISFNFHVHGSQKLGITYDQANELAVGAFTTWQNADCGGGQRPSFRFEDLGPIECNRHQYLKRSSNANILHFAEEEWPYDHPATDIALTLTTFDTSTGEAYDADIAINSANMKFALAGDSPGKYDLGSVLTHEVGHFLGLGHSLDSSAVMRETYASGTAELRELKSDDIAGICALYPPGRNVSADSCIPRHGFAAQCGDEVKDRQQAAEAEESGCSMSAKPAREFGLLSLLGLAATALYRRRKGACGRMLMR
jgi:hypothetical protein